jgi:hypothetical protein
LQDYTLTRKGASSDVLAFAGASSPALLSEDTAQFRFIIGYVCKDKSGQGRSRDISGNNVLLETKRKRDQESF